MAVRFIRSGSLATPMPWDSRQTVKAIYSSLEHLHLLIFLLLSRSLARPPVTLELAMVLYPSLIRLEGGCSSPLCSDIPPLMPLPSMQTTTWLSPALRPPPTFRTLRTHTSGPRPPRILLADPL